jgi:cellulose 1,4-beta-cellobiosidase
MVINFETVAGSYYRVERTDRLGSNPWIPVVDLVTGTGGIMSVTDFGGAGQPSRFYRVVLLDNDYVQSLIVSTNHLTVIEGGTASFTVRLAINPTTNIFVKIARIAGDTDLDVSGSGTLTFTPTNWNVPQMVILHAGVDADTSNGQATFAISSSGLARQLLTATESDNISQTELRLLSINFVGTNVVVSFTTQTNKLYSLEYSAGVDDSWNTATNSIAGTGGTAQATDAGGAIHPRRFYRVREQP